MASCRIPTVKDFPKPPKIELQDANISGCSSSTQNNQTCCEPSGLSPLSSSCLAQPQKRITNVVSNHSNSHEVNAPHATRSTAGSCLPRPPQQSISPCGLGNHPGTHRGNPLRAASFAGVFNPHPPQQGVSRWNGVRGHPYTGDVNHATRSGRSCLPEPPGQNINQWTSGVISNPYTHSINQNHHWHGGGYYPSAHNVNQNQWAAAADNYSRAHMYSSPAPTLHAYGVYNPGRFAGHSNVYEPGVLPAQHAWHRRRGASEQQWPAGSGGDASWRGAGQKRPRCDGVRRQTRHTLGADALGGDLPIAAVPYCRMEVTSKSRASFRSASSWRCSWGMGTEAVRASNQAVAYRRFWCRLWGSLGTSSLFRKRCGSKHAHHGSTRAIYLNMYSALILLNLGSRKHVFIFA
ncbi:hypothetical protein ACP70R_047708 [Stipagrostis hirtigluma subsp. patula]